LITFGDLFLHNHLVIKSDLSTQQVVSSSSGRVFPLRKMTGSPFELAPCFSPVFFLKCFSQVLFPVFFLKCFSQVLFPVFFLKCFSQLPAADDGAAI
jgi:hypothetical protein